VTSPGGPARAPAPVSRAAGTGRAADEDTPEGPPAGEGLRSVPDPPPDAVPPDAASPDAVPEESAAPAGPDAPEGPDSADEPAAEVPAPPEATTHATHAAHDGAGDGWPGTGPDTGTVRRSRPSRSPRPHVGVPTPPSPMNAAGAPPGTPADGTPTNGSAPPPGTPPPGTAMPTGTATPPGTAMPGTPSGGWPAPPSDLPPPAPHRPVPPTFPSPGQPPPGVARRHGRHARPERPGAVHTPPSGYRPRHAAPDAETEQFAATPVTGPGGIGPMPLPADPDEDGGATVWSADSAATTADTPTAAALAAPGGTYLHTGPGVVVPAMTERALGTDPDGSDRVRVVLAERRVPTRAVRTVAEIEQQTETGELLLRNLLRAQLALGLRLGLVAVFVLGALPVMFLVLPRFGAVEVAGVTLPWLVLGLAPYPFMLALAWLYVRTAERNELDFADNVED
jgi:hypothetical protein